jgi:hypothetical protein
MSSPPYEVTIDFDEASRQWMRNKKRKKGYIYCCGKTKRNGKPCRRQPWFWKRVRDRNSVHYMSQPLTWGLCSHHERLAHHIRQIKAH